MPHPTKKQRLEGHPLTSSSAVAANDDSAVTFDDLSVDVLANILAFLPLKNMMRSRRINKKTMEAVKKTIVPLTDFRVDNAEKYNTMAVMTRALPNLQQIKICAFPARGSFGWDDNHKYNDGEDPDEEEAARTADSTTYDIEIVSTFSKLRILEIHAPLNGRYPFLFHSFPLLQKLNISAFNHKWDLEMLAGLPLLKELYCWNNKCLTGNINSLRVLKGTLEQVHLGASSRVEGNIVDLADFPHLKLLYLFDTAVTGGILDIGDHDFLSLEKLILPKGVYGGDGYELQRISDAHDLIRSLYLLKKRRPLLAILKDWHGELSEDSLDGYEEWDYDFPFTIHFVKAGSRIGYRWETPYGDEGSCEVNWLDPEPDRESGDYEKYLKALCNIDAEVKLFKGFYQPPSEEEYHRLVEEDTQRRRAERLLDEYEARGEPDSVRDESDEGYSSEEW